MSTFASVDRRATQSDQAYEAIKADILDRRLAPGAKVTISEVAMRLGCSPGAVREALSRLAAERWAVATAQKPQARVQRSPAIINVAVPLLQHSQ